MLSATWTFKYISLLLNSSSSIDLNVVWWASERVEKIEWERERESLAASICIEYMQTSPANIAMNGLYPCDASEREILLTNNMLKWHMYSIFNSSRITSIIITNGLHACAPFDKAQQTIDQNELNDHATKCDCGISRYDLMEKHRNK